METFPLSDEDYTRIKDAAKFWAWYHNVRIRTEKINMGDGTAIVRVTLISRKRIRDEDELS